ncbi:MAG: hypothetical protein JWN51_2094, partial [Phycisphaerales bacterium]|nr:hypothetical protein [Phycisphaerales bacterium]
GGAGVKQMCAFVDPRVDLAKPFSLSLVLGGEGRGEGPNVERR